MTNYSALMTLLVTLALMAGATPAAASSAAVVPTAAPAKTPADSATPVAAPTPGGTRYVQAAAGSSLGFAFVQADAVNQGAFKKFGTRLAYDEKNLAASTLEVTVQVGSLDTRDADRDETLKGTDLLDAAKYPTAQYVASSFAKRSDGQLEAVGKLTLHGVTRELRLPLTLKPTAAGLELSGETSIRRLDYGVGQGDWKSTDMVGNDVKLKYQVALGRAH
jgi:polyisoprenoid-binding protein YceI